MKKILFVAALVLFILHQDFWLWDSEHLGFGFLPAGLAYHATFSLLAALLWFLFVKYAWPDTSRITGVEEPGEKS